MGDAGIDAILQFHFVFDEIGCISGYADVFEAIENEILLCFERLGERFKFGGECEEQISAARRAYNGAVTVYNNACEMFPTNIIASVFNFAKAEFFAASEQEKQAPNVSELFKK